MLGKRYYCLVAFALSAACSGPQLPLQRNGAEPFAQFNAAKNGHETLYVFKGTPDGATSYAPLLYFKGAFYGTTTFGGKGAGTVFTITKTGKERVLYNFGGELDGEEPYGGLVAIGDTMYGTTAAGGAYRGFGTVFSITSSGKERVLHNFGQRGDGANPSTVLTVVDGVLYGTTGAGGKFNSGAVFRITPLGRERVLYSFPQSGSTGANPDSAFLNVKNTLYGVTYDGGTTGGGACGDPAGCGVVYSITLDGKESVVYAFKGFNSGDGEYPHCNLIAVDGTLYGTTSRGGNADFGTVFSVTLAGQETVVHSFYDKSIDGATPDAGLTQVNGTLYGTTEAGGTNGYGTVFALAASGEDTVLYDFRGQRDGESPYAPLAAVGRRLYGTTADGGTANAGTIYRVSVR